MRDLTHEERNTPRYQRAVRLANTLYSIMRDFLPQDRVCKDRILDHLFELGYKTNSELIEVPIEFDAFNKLQLERAMIEKHPLFVVKLDAIIEDKLWSEGPC